jgi:predicted outer membrane repeat protein
MRKTLTIVLECLENRCVPSSIWFVNRSARRSDTGQDWADAFTRLQSALSAARPGDQIWVPRGVYTPSGSGRDSSFVLPAGVSVLGGFSGNQNRPDQRSLSPNVTILSGDIGARGNSRDNAYHVVTATDLTAPTLLDGFTITAGLANGPEFSQPRGGGMYVDWANPLTVSNVTFRGNRALLGGGMFVGSSSPTLTNVTFIRNTASLQGGGLYDFHSSSPTLENVTFRENTAAIQG